MELDQTELSSKAEAKREQPEAGHPAAMKSAAMTLEAKTQVVQNSLAAQSINLSCEDIDAFLLYLETEKEWAEVYRRLANS
ncbi:MAG: hypothetical protein HY785_00250 [Oscillatoriophycideae cyanobacterium NC_groundwater_1537_Pr4_S-0.65um_50_18]|nr:hypothetical protein [Oscillatoriophycideae cyanobacterium NC_groundwater_1537_Pr4_S-0.65um_50_18]